MDNAGLTSGEGSWVVDADTANAGRPLVILSLTDTWISGTVKLTSDKLIVVIDKPRL